MMFLYFQLWPANLCISTFSIYRYKIDSFTMEHAVFPSFPVLSRFLFCSEDWRWNRCLSVLFSDQAEGWAWSERGVRRRVSRSRGGALLVAGAQNAPPAANLAGLWLHAATLHRLPTWVCRPQLAKGDEALSVFWQHLHASTYMVWNKLTECI